MKLQRSLVAAAILAALAYDPASLAGQPKSVLLLIAAALFLVTAAVWRVQLALTLPLALFGGFALWSLVRGATSLSAAWFASFVLGCVTAALPLAKRRQSLLLVSAGIGVGAAVITCFVWARAARGMALHGGMGNPNTLGLLLSVTLVPSLVAAVAAVRARARVRWLWVAAVVLQVAAWGLAESRAAWLALPAGLAVMWARGRWRVGWWVTLGLALASGFAAVLFNPSAGGGAPGALAGRFWIWKHSLSVALRCLPWGSGEARFNHEFLSEQGRALASLDVAEASRSFVHPGTAHNEWLHAFASSGVIGVGLLLALLATGIQSLGRRSPAGAGALAALAVGASADVPLHAPALIVLTALTLAEAPRFFLPARAMWASRVLPLVGLVIAASALTREARQWRSTRLVSEARQADMARRARLLSRAVELAPDSAEAEFSLGMEQVERGEVAQGLTHLLRSRALSKNVSTEVAIGNTLVELRRLPEARATFEAALELNPGSFRAHANLAATLGELGDDDGAERELVLAQQLYPGHPKLALIAEALRRRRLDRATR
ncbi:MAG: O-antigen ligase family protein [Myxococcales bacterium]|nr:O-antigen ligase family protein [Myxococcales bacterium]